MSATYDDPWSSPAEPVDDERPATPSRRAKITWAHTITMKLATWAWNDDDGNGRIPIGVLAFAAGREGTGKSSFGIWLAANITRGTLRGAWWGKPRRVLYVATEDSWAHTLAPRLAAAGADLAMVGRFDILAVGDREVTMSLPVDNDLLEDSIREHDVAMVVLDPLMSLMGTGVDTHRARDVRTVLDPLAGIADRTGAVMLAIAHFNKGAGSDPSSLITGSGAFKDVARAVFGFVRDDQSEEGHRVMSQAKNSLGLDGSSLASLRYSIESTDVETPDGTTSVGRFVWQGVSDRSAEEILRDSASLRNDDDREDRDEAAAWLAGYLEEKGGEANAADIYRDGQREGYSKDVLKRTKRKLSITSAKGGMKGGWLWKLSTEPDDEGCEGSAKGAKGAGLRPLLPSPPSVLPSEAAPSEIGTCADCGKSMRVLEPGQTMHPTCPALTA